MKVTKRRIVSGSPASRCRSEMNSVVTAIRGLLKELDRLDRDRLDRHVLAERAGGAGWAMADLVDDAHPVVLFLVVDDLAEHRITPARGPRVQIDIVREVDIELARARVRIVGAREPDGAAQVAEAVAG